MRFRLNEIENIVGILPPATKLSEELSVKSIEVNFYKTIGAFDEKIVAGLIKKVWPHPNAERLRIATVFDGKLDRQIVCGGQNLQAGKLGILALPGAKLPSGVEIETTEIRGIKSEGMLCSAGELGLSPSPNKTIDYLKPDSLKPGQSLRHLCADTVFDVEVLANRPDLTGILWIAREVSAVFKNKPLKLRLQESVVKPGTDIKIDIDSSTKAPVYNFAIFENIEITESYFEEKFALYSHGMPAINNLVDATNLTMLSLAQPIHAFDRAAIANPISVNIRFAKNGEELTVLGKKKLQLTEKDVVIDINGKAEALAGIIGGDAYSVTDKTQSILLESANFDRALTRRTARFHGLQTEAGNRFEKGSDPHVAKLAISYFLNILKTTSPNITLKSINSSSTNQTHEPNIRYQPEQIRKLLNLPTDTDPSKYLAQLGFETQPTVKPPIFRQDIEKEIDLSEEVARLYDLNRVPAQPISTESTNQIAENEIALKRNINRFFSEIGFNEVINYPFYLRPDKYLLTDIEGPLLTNPIADFKSLVTEGATNILAAVRNNRDYLPDSRYFEITKSFQAKSEESIVSFAVQNSLRAPLENLKWLIGKFSRQYNKQFGFKPFSTSNLNGWEVLLDGNRVGYLAMINELSIKQLDLYWPTGIGEINLSKVFASVSFELKPLPQHFGKFDSKSLERRESVDISIKLKGDLDLNKINRQTTDLLKEHAQISSFALWDVFESKKSITIRFYGNKSLDLESIEKSLNEKLNR